MVKEQGLRYNKGKLRYDLLHPVAQEGIVKVLTKGSEKYAPRNWEKGMPWTDVIASLKRHLAAIEKGEDYDPEDGLLHIDHLQCNAHFLSAYYKIAPQFDDRRPLHLNRPKIGLDIDEVLADWVGEWIKLYNMNVPGSWFFDREIMKRFEEMRKTEKLDDFYLSLKPKVSPLDLPFEPFVYVTSRPVSSEITEKWLDLHGFPARPVITVPIGESKVQILKNLNVEIFIDDRFDNFVDITNSGIFCYLWDTPHNQRYDVGHRRLKHFKDMI